MAEALIQVVEDFYADPDKVRQRALAMPFDVRRTNFWKTHTYHPRGIRERIEKRFRVRIKQWEIPSVERQTENGSFYTSFSEGSRAERVGVHYDDIYSAHYSDPSEWFILIIYLTPNAPPDAGTSLWQHRKTGLRSRPTRKDAYRLKHSVRELDDRLIRDRYIASRWREIDRVGNRYNRAVMIPGKSLHSATRHFGSNFVNGRIYQVYYFPIEMAAGLKG